MELDAKMSKNKGIKQIHEFISKNKFMIKFVDQHWKDSKTSYTKFPELKPFENEIKKIIRTFKWSIPLYDGQDIFDLTPEEVLFLKLSGMQIVKEKIVGKKEYSKYLSNKRAEMHSNGYVINLENDDLDTKISFDGYSFANTKAVIKFLFDVIKLDQIIITDDFISNINAKFGTEIQNVRSLIARMEDWEFTSKIDSNRFAKIRFNEVQISREIDSIISRLEFNFINKEMFLLLCAEISSKHDLMFDEPYYIFKKHFSKKYSFSTGNSMFISKDSKLAAIIGEKRLNEVYKVPTVVSQVKFSFDTGLSAFAKNNFKTVFAMGKENLLIYNGKNEIHNKFIREKFSKFFNDKKGIQVLHADLRKFCEYSDDEFLNSISEIFNFKFILSEAFGKELQIKQVWEAAREANRLVYIYGQDVESSIKYIDIDDWGDL